MPVGPGTVTIQVLDRQGRIAYVSPDGDLLVPLLPPGVAAANARDGRAVFLDGRPFGLPGEVRVATVAIRGGGTVIAAVAYNPVAESLATLGRALVIGTPVLLVLLAGASLADRGQHAAADRGTAPRRPGRHPYRAAARAAGARRAR